MITAVVGLLVAMLPSFVITTPTPSSADQTRTIATGTPRVKVTTSDNGEQRTYVATVFDANNRLVPNAALDMSAMTDNPDVRVATEAMTPVAGAPGTFTRTVEFPAAGDWVLVVRVHEPLSFVHLLTERVDSDSLPSADAHIDTPSRQHLRELAPDFNARYDPVHGIGSSDPQPLLAAQTATASHQHTAESESAATGGTANGPVWKWVWAVLCSAIAVFAIRNVPVRKATRS